MKKKILITIVIVTLLITILAGCTKAALQPSSAAPLNPPAAPVGSSPSTMLPPSPSPVTMESAETSSSMLQSDLPLRVSEPADAATLNTDTVTVKGQTQPGATVNVNDQIGTADAEGNFSVSIALDDGLNAIDVIATDNNGKQGEILLMVNVDLSQTTSSRSSQGSSSATAGTSQSAVPLKILTPSEGADINADTVMVTGQTAPGATVSINDQADIADDSGNFSIPISLSDDPNAIDVVSIDDNGNQNEMFLMVNRGTGS